MRNKPILHEASKTFAAYINFMPIQNGQFHPDDRGCLLGYTDVNRAYCSYQGVKECESVVSGSGGHKITKPYRVKGRVRFDIKSRYSGIGRTKTRTTINTLIRLINDKIGRHAIASLIKALRYKPDGHWFESQ
jgi:hypothetical protein